MSKQFDKLEEVFELPDLDLVKGTSATTEEVVAALETVEEISKEFDKINHFDQHDTEMDELAELAKQAHKDMMELGMNVEVKHAGEIFSGASQMLKIAVDAKHLKVDKKLKLLRLQIDKQRIDRMSGNDSNTVEGTAVTLDRNEILKQLKQMSAGDK